MHELYDDCKVTDLTFNHRPELSAPALSDKGWSVSSPSCPCSRCWGVDGGCKRLDDLVACVRQRDQFTARSVPRGETVYHVSIAPAFDLQRFIVAMYEPDDLILNRPVETWEEQPKDAEKRPEKRSRIIFDRVRHRTARHMAGSVLLWKTDCDAAEHERANLFFGVCPRVRRPRQVNDQRLTWDHSFQIRVVRCLWADLDYCTPEEALRRCEDAGLPRPTIIVSSGNGVHLYWRLVEPFLIDDAGDPPPVVREIGAKLKSGKQTPYSIDEEGKRLDRLPLLSPKAKEFEAILKGVQERIGGDHTTDLARVLRLPATMNRKNERNGKEPKPCQLIECDAARRYPLEFFRPFAAPVEIKSHGGCGKAQPEFALKHSQAEQEGTPFENSSDAESSSDSTTTRVGAGAALGDEEIIHKASRAKNGSRFLGLWQGDLSGYESHSHADQALCFILAFWSQDVAQIDRLFRRSGLYRDKWNRDSYREQTIRKALASGGERWASRRGQLPECSDEQFRELCDMPVGNEIPDPSPTSSSSATAVGMEAGVVAAQADATSDGAGSGPCLPRADASVQELTAPGQATEQATVPELADSAAMPSTTEEAPLPEQLAPLLLRRADLDDLEEECVAAVTTLLNRPGHHVLGVSCRQELVAAKAVARAGLPQSLTIVSTHATNRSTVKAFTENRLEARAYPKLCKDTCLRWSVAANVEAVGLPVTMILCQSCPHREGSFICDYMKMRAEAEAAPHLIVTGTRASIDPAERLGHRDAALFVYASPVDVLHPTQNVHVERDSGYRKYPCRFNTGLHTLKWAAMWIPEIFASIEMRCPAKTFWGWVHELAHQIEVALDGNDVVEIRLPRPEDLLQIKPDYDWASQLWTILQDSSCRPAAGVTRVILAAATGELESLFVLPAGFLAFADPEGHGACRDRDPEVGGHLVAVRHLRRFPEKAVVVDLGPSDAWTLSSGTEVTWEPAPVPPPATPWGRITQHFQTVTARSSPRLLLDRVRLMLHEHKGTVGVVGNQRLLKRLSRQMTREGWSIEQQVRVVFAPWYSHEAALLRECDIILGLGGPRLHPVAVFKRLIQAHDPAAKVPPGWGEIEWEGLGANGQPMRVCGHGYTQPRWQEVACKITREVLQEMVGCLRCPVVILADDRLELPMCFRAKSGLAQDAEKVLGALVSELQAVAREKLAVNTPRPVDPVSTRRLAAVLCKSDRTVRSWLTRLAECGVVRQVGQKGGWTLCETSGGGVDVPKGMLPLLDALRNEHQCVADPSQSSDGLPISSHVSTLVSIIGTVLELRLGSAIPTSAIADRLGLSYEVVRRHLSRLESLGFVLRQGRGNKTRWTLTELVSPATVADPAALPAYEEIHGVQDDGTTRPADGQGVFSFALNEYTASLARETDTDGPERDDEASPGRVSFGATVTAAASPAA